MGRRVTAGVGPRPGPSKSDSEQGGRGLSESRPGRAPMRVTVGLRVTLRVAAVVCVLSSRPPAATSLSPGPGPSCDSEGPGSVCCLKMGSESCSGLRVIFRAYSEPSEPTLTRKGRAASKDGSAAAGPCLITARGRRRLGCRTRTGPGGARSRRHVGGQGVMWLEREREREREREGEGREGERGDDINTVIRGSDY